MKETINETPSARLGSNTETPGAESLVNPFTKSLLVLLAAFVIVELGTSAMAQTAPASFTEPCLRASYPLDVNTLDVTGQNNPSAISGVSFVPGKVGNGALFTTGSFIDIPESASLTPQNVTLEAWVRADGPGPNDDTFGSIIVQKGLPPPAGNTDVPLSLYWSAQSQRFIFLFGNLSQVIQSTDTYPSGQFHHVAGTYDGTTFKLYVDATLQGQFALVTTINYVASIPWQIGSSSDHYRNNNYPRTWNGVIDEVNIWGCALSQAEIQLHALLNSPPVARCKNVKVFAGCNNTSANASINDGSSDPDGDDITLEQDPKGPYPLGETLVTLKVTDPSGETNTCTATVTVVQNLFAADGIIWHQPLARNGMSEDTDPGNGNTLKYRFKLGSTIPIKVHAQGCSADVTGNANVSGTVVVFGDTDMDGVIDSGELPIDYNGVGEAGGVMDKINGHLKYNLDTKKLVQTFKCYILQVTITDSSTGESVVELVPLQAK